MSRQDDRCMTAIETCRRGLAPGSAMLPHAAAGRRLTARNCSAGQVAAQAPPEERTSDDIRFALAKFRPTTRPDTVVARSGLHDRLTAGAGQRLTVVRVRASCCRAGSRPSRPELSPGCPAMRLMMIRSASGPGSSRPSGSLRRDSVLTPPACSRRTGSCRLMSSPRSPTMPRSCPPGRWSSRMTSRPRSRRPPGT